MKARLVAGLAGTFAASALALVVLYLVLAPGVGRAARTVFGAGGWQGEMPFILTMAATALVGAVIAAKRPRNPIGWLLAVLGLSFVAFPNTVVAAASAAPSGNAPTFIYLVAWVGNWIWVPGHAGALFTLLLFPNGRLLSRRLRPLAFFTAAVLLALLVSAATFRGPLEAAPRLENPFALPIPEPVSATLILAVLALQVLACGLLVVRFWRSRGEERQQMKWVAFGAAILAASFLLNLAGITLPRWTDSLGTAVMISAVAIAVLRHRLYDIDVLINRTLVYGALTGALVAVYAGGVAVLQYAFRALAGQESQLVIVASTLAIAALFSPLRQGIQALIDGLFYRRKYDAQRTLAAFGVRLRGEVELDHLADDFVAVVERTVQPAHASLWLREMIAEPRGLATSEEREN